MEGAQLMVGVRPQLAEHGRVEVRAVGDDGPRLQPPGLEVAEEPPHVVLIVGADQGEGHRQVADRIGGQQQGEPAQVDLIDAETVAELPQDHAAQLGHVELSRPVAEHVIDEAGGELQQEFPAQRPEGPLDAHAVLDDPTEDQIADRVVVGGPGEDAVGGTAEGGAAIAAGTILAAGDLEVGDGLVGDGADPARRQRPLAAAQPAAHRAGGLLGCAVDGYSDDRGCLGAHACVLRGEGCSYPHSRGRRPYPSRPKRLIAANRLVVFGEESQKKGQNNF
jgi:hypothetical protein